VRRLLEYIELLTIQNPVLAFGICATLFGVAMLSGCASTSMPQSKANARQEAVFMKKYVDARFRYLEQYQDGSITRSDIERYLRNWDDLFEMKYDYDN
jgi:hypothetical protein